MAFSCYVGELSFPLYGPHRDVSLASVGAVEGRAACPLPTNERLPPLCGVAPPLAQTVVGPE